MMKNIFKNKIVIAAFFLTIVSVGFFANSVSAAGLVPCGDGNDPAQRCTLCHLVLGIKNIIDWGFRIFVVVALLMLVVGGVMYIISAGDDGLIKTAKGVLTNALYGFVFVLLAWLLVNFTIMLLGANVGVDVQGRTWNNFTCEATRSAMNSTPSTTSPNTSGGQASNCTGTITAHTQACDNQNPSSSMPWVWANRGKCTWLGMQNYEPGKCYRECIDGYSLQGAECVQDRVIPCTGSGSCKASCSGAETEFTERSSCTTGQKCCLSMDSIACKSGNTNDPWVGGCFKECLTGWTEKTGTYVQVGIKCRADNLKCCVRN